ncbi:MAG: hypothetical protein GOU97_00460, partial [Nanoarchaeota archaeon]|nr:hypothetical protein [Nanoarchaeota archaeon]
VVNKGFDKNFAWFEFQTIKFSPHTKHYGPPVWVEKNYFEKFVNKWKKVWVEGDKLVTTVKRDYKTLEELTKRIWKKNG